MEYEYVAVPLVGGLWEEHHWQYWRDRLLAEGWTEFVRASWAPRAPEGTGGACIMRRPKDEPRMWTEREIEEVAKRYHWQQADSANVHPHVGSNPFCQCDECTAHLKEETNG